MKLSTIYVTLLAAAVTVIANPEADPVAESSTSVRFTRDTLDWILDHWPSAPNRLAKRQCYCAPGHAQCCYVWIAGEPGGGVTDCILNKALC
jgi:hypothetical protein